MATVAAPARRHPFAPDAYERVLSVGAMLLLVAVAVAVSKGRSEWSAIGPGIWAHLATIVIALVLTPVMLLRPRGDSLHRKLGWIWAASLLLTALISFAVRNLNHGGLSIIHVLSAWTLLQVPLIVWSARTHNVKRHRAAVRGMVTGALLVAGFFTFPFNRLLGHWLFS